jgi:hypothetical protein
MLWKRFVFYSYLDKTQKSLIFPNLRNNQHTKYSSKFPNFSLMLYFLVHSLPHYMESYAHVGNTGPLKRRIIHLSTLIERRALSENTRLHHNINETARSHFLNLFASEHLQVILKTACWDTLEHSGRSNWWRPVDFPLNVRCD